MQRREQALGGVRRIRTLDRDTQPVRHTRELTDETAGRVYPEHTVRKGVRVAPAELGCELGLADATHAEGDYGLVDADRAQVAAEELFELQHQVLSSDEVGVGREWYEEVLGRSGR